MVEMLLNKFQNIHIPLKLNKIFVVNNKLNDGLMCNLNKFSDYTNSLYQIHNTKHKGLNIG